MMIQTKMQIIRRLLLLLLAGMPLLFAEAAVEKEAVYSGDTLLWRCQMLGENGTYTDGPSHTMQFSVLAPPTTEEVALSICKGDTLLWNCKQLWVEGTYRDTAWYDEFPTMAKTYYTLDLSVKEPTQMPAESITMLQGDTLLWRCKMIKCDAVGAYEYTDEVYEGSCLDKVYKLNLTVIKLDVEEVAESETICEGDTLLWRCQQLYAAGTYYDTLKYKQYPAYDSVRYALTLTMHEPTQMPAEDITMLLGETLLWRCEMIACDAVGNYTYKDTTYEGSCADKVYQLNLKVEAFEVEEVEENETICQGDTLLWRCQQLYAAGTYYDTLKSLQYPAYDSVRYTMHVSLSVADEIHESATIRMGETLLWRCLQIEGETKGVKEYRDTVRSVTGCPTEIYILTLTVEEPEVQNVVEEYTICGADTLLWRCQQVYAAGEYFDTLQSLAHPGYDSVYYELHLTVNKDSVAPVEVKYIEPGESFDWIDGNSYTEAGEHTYQTYYDNGCDSVLHRLQVVLYDSTSMRSCDGEVVLWRCFEANETKIYRDTVRAISMFTGEEYAKELYVLNFTFHGEPKDSVKDEVATAVPYLWRGQSLTESGTYHDTVYVVPGDKSSCVDSLFTLNLKVELVKDSVTEATTCQGDTLLWRCQLVYATGEYTDKEQYQPSGNDSIRYTLNLTVNKDSVAPVEVAYIEPGGSYAWIDGNTYDAAGEYQYQTHYDNGCDSVLHRLQVVLYDSTSMRSCDGEVVLWRCFEANETKIYRDTVRAISMFTGEEYAKELYVLNFTFHGEPKDSVKDEVATAVPYLWRGQSLTESGTYHDTVYVVPGDKSSCVDSLFTLNLKVELAKDSVTEATICQGDTLLWRCQQVYATGEYTDKEQYQPSGNDSIRYTLHLTVNKDSVAPVEVKYIEPDESFDWIDGNSYTEAGEHTYQTYYDNGCDSVLHRLQVVKYDSTALTSCDGEVVLWRCFEANETKIYRDTVRAISMFTGEEYAKELYVLNFTFHGEPVDSVKDEVATAVPYLWRGQSLEESGTYHDTVYVVPGDKSSCVDSLFTLNLKVELVKDSVTEATICQGDTLLWRCQQVYATGEYTDKEQYQPSGNDSIRYTLHLTVNKDSVAPLTVETIVPGDSVVWFAEDGSLAVYKEAGEHLYQSQHESGCDSVLHRLRIVLFDSTFVSKCDGETYEWRERVFDRDTVVRDTVRATSIFAPYEEYDKEYYILNFDFHAAAVDSVLNDTISSDNLPYLWRGAERWGASLSVDTTYVENHYFADDSECVDTMFTLNLHVDVVESVVLADTLCQGDTLLWHCQQVYATGTYYDTLRYASTGNDSIRYALSVLVQKDSVAPLQEVILCNNDSLLWFDGTWIKESGHYDYQSHYAPTMYQQQIGAEGCDSVYHELVVIARHVRDTLMTDTICESDVANYIWRGKHAEVSTTDLMTKMYEMYDTAHYAGSTGCDSIRYKLELTVQRPTRMTATDTTVCKDDVINFRWKPYNTEFSGFTKTTTMYDTARFSITGCDSVIYQLNLKVLEPLKDTIVTDTTLCYSDVMEWHGQTYTAEGRYEHTLYFAGTECDSAYCRLQLHYRALPDTAATTATICKGSAMNWGSQKITEAGVYWDSVFYEGTQCVKRYDKLTVTVLEPTVVDTVAAFCEGGSFTWDRTGITYTEPGTYEHQIAYQVLDGCDSVIIYLNLAEIVPEEVEPETQYICNGETYTWHGKPYTTTGVYRDTAVSVLTGCDSAYYTLNLEKQEPMSKQSDTLYICGTGQVTWSLNNHVYSHAGIYYDTIPTIHGCDSIAGELRVVEQPVETKEPENISIYQTQTYTWRDGREYSDPGTYEYIEYYPSGCDSVIYTLNLVVLDIEHTEVTVTDIVCPNDVYEGHAISEHTQWSDTVRTTDASGALVDVVTNYDIDVYDTTLPDGFMNFVVASCGLPVNADSASTLLDNYINSSANYAEVKNIRWEYSEDGGAWKALDGATTLGGQIENVAVRCVVETECGEEVVEQMYKVGTHATPEIFVEYDQLPVIRKFNGTMLMVDVDDICKKFGWTNGKEITPEIVEWYMQVGELDNLSYPKADDPKDQPMNKYGYYYTPQTADTYYALIKGNLPVDNDNCGVWARTLTVSGNSPIQLQPNVAQGGATVTIEAVTQCYVTITDMYGNVVMGRTASSGTFKAPASAGTYFVTIESDNSVCHRTLIVY